MTEAARLHGFPVPLCAAAEQAYLTGLLHDFGPEDDAGMVRIYCPHFATPESVPIESPTQEDAAERIQLVLDLLEIVHLVAAAEAISFANRLGLDLKQFALLVNDAAGGTAAFQSISPFMLRALGISGSASKGPDLDNSLESCITSLNKVINKARNLTCPLHLANAALGVLTVTKQITGPTNRISSTIRYYSRDFLER